MTQCMKLFRRFPNLSLFLKQQQTLPNKLNIVNFVFLRVLSNSQINMVKHLGQFFLYQLLQEKSPAFLEKKIMCFIDLDLVS